MPDAADARFSALLNAHGGLLWRIAGAYSRTRPDREDLYQETLLQVWRALPAFRGDASERTWITRIAFNVALGTVRREAGRRTADAAEAVEAAPAPGPDPAEAVALADDVARLYAALGRLSEVDRALVLLALDGRSHAEMADVLGLSVVNVGVRLHRARRHLAGRLADPLPALP